MVFALVAALLGLSLLASAQTTNATCGVAHKWAFNSKKQSPCQVAASLIAVCTGSYEVSALPDGFHYNGPSFQDTNECWCNTVAYATFSECALCQGRTFVQWSVWGINCPSVAKSTFPRPLPAGLRVPGWAYLDVEDSDLFDESAAFANANATESAAPKPSKTSSSVPASTASASASVTPASDTSVETGPDMKRVNAIGGGVVGGLAALALIAGFVFWLYRRRRIAETQGAILRSPAMSQTQADGAHSTASHPVPSITVSTQPGSASDYSAAV
ncbi:hypothetical protein MKEN_01210900 [Mycena kentingensis (nom. inval.)]|nr:hypothetical protein MKEN_01210900 [Mycena kentingensis (nom. inval.)]